MPIVQHTINNSSMYVYECFEFIFVAFVTLVNMYYNKIITTDSPKSHNPVKNVHFIQIVSVMLAIVAYYAQCFCFPIMLKLCWHNRLKPKLCIFVLLINSNMNIMTCCGSKNHYVYLNHNGSSEGSSYFFFY